MYTPLLSADTNQSFSIILAYIVECLISITIPTIEYLEMQHFVGCFCCN